MSFHRENVIWQSADGTWSRGFFETYDIGDRDGEEWDPEWDVEYDFDTFRWVSTGHPTQEEASRAWDGANPGGHSLVEHRDDDRSHRQVEQYDDMAARLWESGSGPRWNCTGVPKSRVPRLIARDIAKGLTDTAHYKLGGYSNMCPDVSGLQQQLAERLTAMSASEREEVADALSEGVKKIRAMLDEPRRTSVGAAEARGALEQLQTQGRSILAEKPAAPSSGAGGSARGKTTAGSTAGSFAPKLNSAPSGHL